MKNLISLFILCLLFATYTQAQQITVALHHNGKATMFYGSNSFSDANTAAVDGDTIYLPGNAHYSGITISHKLVIIGAGVTPDSTSATGRSYIESDINFVAGSDGSLLHGIYTGNSIHFSSNTRINNITLSRCYLGGIYFDGSFDTSHTCRNTVVEQNIITGSIAFDNAEYTIIRNNFIQGRLYDITQNILIENNDLFYPTEAWNNGQFTIYGINNSVVRNNIFVYPAGHTSCYIVGNNNDITNNIFATPSDPSCYSNTYANNYPLEGDTIFVAQTGYYSSFDFSKNYNLKTPSLYPGFYSNGVGVYGGMKPMKVAMVPINPHVISKTIAPSTDNSGNLNINVKVDAQNK